MTKTLLFAFMLTITSMVHAQFEDGTTWKKGGSGNASFSQTSFTNWAEGGEDALNLNLLSTFFANNKEGRKAWDNLLTLGYGLQKLADQDIRKSDDKIDIISKYGIQTTENSKWYYSSLFNFNSQITNTYEFALTDKQLISQFLSPGNFKLGLGMDYKPNETFSVFISPLTADLLMVNNQDIANLGIHGNKVNAIGIGENEKWGLGALLVGLLNTELTTNVNYTGKIELFSDYLNNPQNIDIRWENLLTSQIWKVITVTLAGELRYDHDILIPLDRNEDGIIDENDGRGGRRTQIKEVFGLGLGYTF